MEKTNVPEETPKDEPKAESKKESNEEVCRSIIKFLMTNPQSGEEWSYAESRMRYG